MEIGKIHWIGIGVGLMVVLASLFLIGNSSFFLVIGTGIVIASAPFVFTAINESRMALEKEEMFLEFARNLVEGVKTGTPISKSILHVKDKPYGVLSPHVKKLANQISLGISFNEALETFSKDVNNRTVSRAITLIGQAERAGGDIGEILEAVAEAVNTSDKLKKERRATISTLVAQGYIIFFVFIIIILVMQFKIIPMVSGIGDIGIAGADSMTSGTEDIDEVTNSFLWLLLIQGFFSGLAIGKLAEGNVKAGLKHSFALMLSSFLISAIASIIIG